MVAVWGGGRAGGGVGVKQAPTVPFQGGGGAAPGTSRLPPLLPAGFWASALWEGTNVPTLGVLEEAQCWA